MTHDMVGAAALESSLEQAQVTPQTRAKVAKGAQLQTL